jgi:hypothetical protein
MLARTAEVVAGGASTSLDLDRSPGAVPGGIRPMTPDDVTAVAALYRRIFHGIEEAPSAELVGYVGDLAFGAPGAEARRGGLVHVGATGAIDAAVVTVPMRIVVGDHVHTAEVLSTFMADDRPAARRPGARLARHLARSGHDFLFTDTAKAISAGLFEAFGGTVLPLQSLEWLRVFRPAAVLARLAERRHPGFARTIVLAGPVDRLARRLVAPLAAPEASARLDEIDEAAFVALAPQMVAHRTVRPLWAPEDLAWTLAMARRRERNGRLRLCRIVDRRGETIGACAHWAAPGRIAHVLDLPTLPGREREAVEALFVDLDRRGVAAVRGAGRAGLVEALYRVPGVLFRHNAHAVCLTPLPEAREAIARGDVHLGGLAGESWSRLIADRF